MPPLYKIISVIKSNLWNTPKPAAQFCLVSLLFEPAGLLRTTINQCTVRDRRGGRGGGGGGGEEEEGREEEEEEKQP